MGYAKMPNSAHSLGQTHIHVDIDRQTHWLSAKQEFWRYVTSRCDLCRAHLHQRRSGSAGAGAVSAFCAGWGPRLVPGSPRRVNPEGLPSTSPRPVSLCLCFGSINTDQSALPISAGPAGESLRMLKGLRMVARALWRSEARRVVPWSETLHEP